MPRSAFTDAHQILIQVLIETRKASGLTQVDLADAIKKDQSFISNIERGQRRVDVLEFYVISRALGTDPIALYEEVVKRLPQVVEI